MRKSFANAAEPLAIDVVFPTEEQLVAANAAEDPSVLAPDLLAHAARSSGADEALVGSIAWSDAERGWKAAWQLVHDGQGHRWSVRGVSFDEAFRIAAAGSTQILSGNGSPGSSGTSKKMAHSD